jgi:hypothetical protein
LKISEGSHVFIIHGRKFNTQRRSEASDHNKEIILKELKIHPIKIEIDEHTLNSLKHSDGMTDNNTDTDVTV